jgi:glutaconate CoA-transferase subunit B
VSTTEIFSYWLQGITSAGFLNGGDERGLLGIPGAGPKAVITDLGVLIPDPRSKELVLSQIHPGITFEQIRAATGWDLRHRGISRRRRSLLWKICGCIET